MVFEMNEESVRDFKNLYFKVVPQPGTNPFWIDGEGEYRFPLSWNEEWVNPKVERKELSESELLFIDVLSECWGKKDNHLPTRFLLTQSSSYIQDEILGIMLGKSNAYDRFKVHFLNKSKKLVNTGGSSLGASKAVSPDVVPPTSSAAHDSSFERDTSATPSPSIVSTREVYNSNKDLPHTRKCKTFEPKYGPINSKEFDHTGFAQEYLVGGNNKIPMDGENFIKNLEFVTRSSIKATTICQAAKNKLGDVLWFLKEKSINFEFESRPWKPKSISQDLNAAREMLKKLEKEKSDGEEKYRRLFAEFNLKIENQKRLEAELQAVQELCDKFSNDARRKPNRTGQQSCRRVIVRPKPAADEHPIAEEPIVGGNEHVSASEGSPEAHPTMSDPPPTPPCHGI
ncbi:hypothetical protein PIB30_065487 [Stylosanthes scabra]|uniref:Uncharacterized protein n=1 Tax=Stylosanthes scabra TaxID=79078 RepID=A0ABU6SND5_9FABA|nr:hypothetical protein [Stylosanthes scabra]